jgi:opacity protein-like surface antigen
MSKKLLNALVVGAVMTTALVAGDCSAKSGFYAGISAGAAHLGGKNEYAISGSDAGDTVYSGKGGSSSTSFAGSLLAGYGIKLNSLWFAGEANYQFDNLKNTLTGFAGAAAVKASNLKLVSKSKGAFGASVHAGFFANAGTVIYAILGLESRSFKVKFTDSASQFNNTFNSFKKNYRSTAFVPGLGVRFAIAKNIALKTEYKLAMHKSKRIKVSATDTYAGPYGGNGTDTLSIKHNPKVHTFMVGAAYTF